MLEVVAGVILEFLISLLWWFFLFPVVWLVCVPFILLIALFHRRPYRIVVLEMFVSVHHFWKDWSIMFVP